LTASGSEGAREARPYEGHEKSAPRSGAD